MVTTVAHCKNKTVQRKQDSLPKQTLHCVSLNKITFDLNQINKIKFVGVLLTKFF